MQITGYSWAGIGVGDFTASVHFFATILGMELVFHDEAQEIAKLKVASGQLLEVVGPNNRDYQLHSCPVIGFDVADIREAKSSLEVVGISFITDVQHGSDGSSWAYFRGRDGHVYQLQQSAPQ